MLRRKKSEHSFFPNTLAALTLGLGIITQAFAQPSLQNGATADRREKLEKVVDQIKALMAKDHKPGLLLCIVDKDSVLFDSGLGYSDLERKDTVNSETIFRMGSITKTFTSMAILLLVAEGKIKLDGELKKIAPEIPFENPWEDSHPVKIIHLLEHTAGFDDVHFKAIYNPTSADVTTLEAAKINSNSLKSRWKPGERYSYSNPGYAVLGYVIEKTSGQPWDKYIRDRILIPLGMNHTDFNLRMSSRENQATAYRLDGTSNTAIPFYAMYDGASGSLNSCATDMAKFVQFFLNDWKINGTVWLPQGVLDDMEKGRSSLAARNGMLDCYGMGNAPTAFDSPVLFHGHTGGFPGFSSKFAYNRELGVGYVICNNNETDNAEIANALTRFFTASVTSPGLPAQNINADSLKSYFGYYQLKSSRYKLLGFIESLFDVYKYSPMNNQLLEEGLLGDADTLTRTGTTKFRKKNSFISTYLFTRNGAESEVLVRNKEYYQKVNIVWLRTQQVVFVLALLSIITGFITGIAGIAWIVIKRKSMPKIKYFMTPFLSSALFTVSVGLIIYISVNYLQAPFVNGYTITIFAGSILFAVLPPINIYMLTKSQRDGITAWGRYYFMTVALLHFYLAFLLFQNDWIGLRTWAY